MLLESFITTVPTPTDHPVKIADLGFRAGTKVTIPWGGSRLCDGITLDMHEDLVAKLFEYDGGLVVRDKTLALALKVYYRNKVVFHGPLHAPEFDYATGKVSLAAHDPTLRLVNAYVHEGDSVISGFTLDGDGLFALLDIGQNFASEDTAGDPVLGIVHGKDTTTDSDIRKRAVLGDQVWQTLQDARNLVVAPDINFVPIETDPAELASGFDFANYFSSLPDNTTTDFALPITLPGLIGGLKLGVWVEHTAPGEVNIDLVHPDGSSVRVYTGSKESTALSGSGDFLGSGTGASLCSFELGNSKIYGGVYPHVGTFRPDRSLNAFLDKPAAGTWKLRVHDTAAGNTGAVNQFMLTFELPAPGYCRMDVSDKPDSEALPDPTCTFYKGHASDNASVLKVKPQGDLTRNHFRASAKRGHRVRTNDASKLAYGRYEGFEAGNPTDSVDVLAAYAENIVMAYGRPLPALELAPKNDGGQPGILRYGEDFFEGRYVLAVGKKGNSFHKLLSRVMQVTLENVVNDEGSASVQTEMDVIPAVVLASEVADG